jgi:hypothetical protein
MVALVIISREMQHSVQHQNLDFAHRGMAQAACVLLRDLSGNCDIAR